jgi:nucleoside-diphosphate-sugar epimerase
VGSEIKPDYVKAVLEPRKTMADMSKVKRVLNYEPKTSLEEGLKTLIKGGNLLSPQI